mmetsp:Transcript_36450/g.102760  ORF Transcript_36450/g.102760 Transcript_36450/m.102760 type:complete len:356 (-) Transcript_36450:524-1591(-)
MQYRVHAEVAEEVRERLRAQSEVYASLPAEGREAGMRGHWRVPLPECHSGVLEFRGCGAVRVERIAMETHHDVHVLEEANKVVRPVPDRPHQRVGWQAAGRVMLRVLRDDAWMPHDGLREDRWQLRHVERLVLQLLDGALVAEHVDGVAELVRDRGHLGRVQELEPAPRGRSEVQRDVSVAMADQRGGGERRWSAEERVPLPVKIGVDKADAAIGITARRRGGRRPVEDLEDADGLVPAVGQALLLRLVRLHEVHVVGAPDDLQQPREDAVGLQEFGEPEGVGLACGEGPQKCFVCMCHPCREGVLAARALGCDGIARVHRCPELLHALEQRREAGLHVAPAPVHQLPRLGRAAH